MEKTQTLIVPESFSGMRLDKVLTELMPAHSRSQINRWIKAGYVKQAAHTHKAKDKMAGGELLSVAVVEEVSHIWQAENIALEVVYQDDDLFVINKPAGLVTHPGAGNHQHTLANALLNLDAHLHYLPRAGLVHRLDKNTSGLLVVARCEKARQSLIDQLQKKQVTREYVALVYGHMVSGTSIDAPIGRDHKNRLKQTVVDGGKPASSHVRVLQRFKHHSYLKINLETGRTHQIRVHLSHIGYPIIGDPLYGGKLRLPSGANCVLKEKLTACRRQTLHARKLSLTHPSSGKTMSWCIEMPDDMQTLFAALQNNETDKH